jgi:hypothetical protein
MDIKKDFNRASVLPNAVLEMSEQFVLLFCVPLGNFSLMEFARYNGGSRNFEMGGTPERWGSRKSKRKRNVSILVSNLEFYYHYFVIFAKGGGGARPL